jgi:peptidoglycan pentaglycine glycine transferase (the first glycine)
MDISISKEGLDPEWDRFLETLPDNLYQQSSLWAKVKAAVGWKHLRLVVRENRRIIGGTQMLLRPLPRFGAVGYVSKGPVVASDDPAVQEFILNQLDRVARAEHILFLKIQPPHGAEELAQRLVERGARPSAIPVTPLATLRVDLRPDPEEILAGMNKYTRRNIRRAEGKGVTVRVGTEADIPTFSRLRKIHGQQRGYDPGPEDYYYSLWDTLATGGHFRFFLAEYDGQVLAANSYIAFGDVVLDYHLPDSGLYKKLNAHTLLQWKGMLWAKECGYIWYDFGGIKMSAARAIMSNGSLPDTIEGRRAKFKKSFGGQIMLRPGVYDLSFVWPRRLTVRMIPALMKMKPLLSFLVGGSLARYVRMHDSAAKKVATGYESENDS